MVVTRRIRTATDLEEGGGLRHAVLGPAPAHHEGVLAHEVLPQPGQAHGDDVLLPRQYC